MNLRQLGTTDIRIAPLVLGGNVFGWTADRAHSFAVLDAFFAAGFNAIDTADVYNRYAPGLVGGESETLIGEWMQARGVRDKMVIISKCGLEMGPGQVGLGRDYVPKACDASLKRLRTDYIDVYMAHRDDPSVPIEDTLAAFQSLIDAGKIRATGCSNYAVPALAAALAAGEPGRGRYEVVEPHYNLMDRAGYEGEMEQVCAQYGAGVIAYYALASGFLSGKYRRPEAVQGTSRARMLSTYFTPRGEQILAALDKVAERHQATPAQVALAWVMARPSVTAPIASATRAEQVAELVQAAKLALRPEDFAELDF